MYVVAFYRAIVSPGSSSVSLFVRQLHVGRTPSHVSVWVLRVLLLLFVSLQLSVKIVLSIKFSFNFITIAVVVAFHCFSMQHNGNLQLTYSMEILKVNTSKPSLVKRGK